MNLAFFVYKYHIAYTVQSEMMLYLWMYQALNYCMLNAGLECFAVCPPVLLESGSSIRMGSTEADNIKQHDEKEERRWVSRYRNNAGSTGWTTEQSRVLSRQ
jgi:hypothetical protein